MLQTMLQYLRIEAPLFYFSKSKTVNCQSNTLRSKLFSVTYLCHWDVWSEITHLFILYLRRPVTLFLNVFPWRPHRSCHPPLNPPPLHSEPSHYPAPRNNVELLRLQIGVLISSPEIFNIVIDGQKVPSVKPRLWVDLTYKSTLNFALKIQSSIPIGTYVKIPPVQVPPLV